jgi:RNA polymerase sigma factor for flagellar operon FliA
MLFLEAVEHQAMNEGLESMVDTLTNERYAHELIDGAELSARDKKVIDLYFFKGLTFKEIGAEFNVTIERARQLHKRAIRKMKTFSNKH